MKHFERILYPLMSSIISYIRMINYFSPHYYFVSSSFIGSFKKNEMDVCRYIHSFIIFFPGEGGVGVSSGMSGSNLPQRHYCLGRMDICCLLSRVNGKRVRATSGENRRYNSIFLVLLKSVLIFHRQGFYCTDSIHENSRLTILFFKSKCS